MLGSACHQAEAAAIWNKENWGTIQRSHIYASKSTTVVHIIGGTNGNVHGVLCGYQNAVVLAIVKDGGTGLIKENEGKGARTKIWDIKKMEIGGTKEIRISIEMGDVKEMEIGTRTIVGNIINHHHHATCG